MNDVSTANNADQILQHGAAWRAALTVWGVVNAVNLLQALGFLTRARTGSMAINHVLGYGLIGLAVPTALALVAFWRAHAGWRHRLGPVVYLTFIGLMLVVDYLWPIEFRSPGRPAILVPYLMLFFGAIVLMGAPMFALNRRLWLATVVTTALLLGAMGVAIATGQA
ncbi:MAG: hypothetical protein HGA45_01025 [Chloroflexales bacterium]|nr:hypothetical protein [Chloroflexales bacterium]